MKQNTNSDERAFKVVRCSPNDEPVEPASDATNPIIVSVIVPMRNEEKYIGDCLDSILENDYPRGQFEVLVVDGRSTDNSRTIVNQKIERCSSVRLIDNPDRIVPTGLNSGIRQAKGKYVVIMGAHAKYPSNYLSTCIEELERSKADGVGGSLATQPGADSLIARAIALLSQHRFGVGNSGFRIGWGDRFVDTVPYPAFRREVFDRVGLYRVDLVRNQDWEFSARIRNAGGKLFLSSRIRNTYYNVPTFSKLMSQAGMNGLWIGRGWIQYPVSFCWRHAVPLVFVSAVFGSLVLAMALPKASLFPVVILSTYLLCAFGAAAQLAIRNGLRFFFVLPGLFFAYHFSHGLGTLYGLMTFLTARREKRS